MTLVALIEENVNYLGGAGCDICSQSCAGSWHCRQCSFDLCGECSGTGIPPKTLRHQLHEHNLTFLNLGELQALHSDYSSVGCDNCSTQCFCSYHCEQCCYDLCFICALGDYSGINESGGGDDDVNTPPQEPDTEGLINISRGKEARASSSESEDHLAKFAVDGNDETRFASKDSDPQWLEVDLGALHQVCHVSILWEAAFAQEYEIQLSKDRVEWTTGASVEIIRKGWVKTKLPESSEACFVRMYGISRGTDWGYSIYHFNVYGRLLVQLRPQRIVTIDSIHLGVRVVRGLHWPTTSSFDGVYGYPGTVIAFKRPGEEASCTPGQEFCGPDKSCAVKWDLTSNRAVHRIGAGGKYELYFHPEHAPDNSIELVPDEAEAKNQQEIDSKQEEQVDETKSVESLLWSTPRDERQLWREKLQHQPLHRSETSHLQDSNRVDRILQGKLFAADVVSKPKSISIFVSSTFTDTASERNLLIADVYPYAKRYAALLGLEFSASEMRWGIREEASDSHQTSAICMAELARCQQVSLGLNYVLILGNKYGYRPFPNQIPVAEFEALVSKMSPTDSELVRQWFLENSNLVPPMMELQPTTLAAPGTWWPIFEQMQKAFREARHVLSETKRSDLYNVSVTECEITNGLLSLAEPRAFVYHRVIDDIDVSHPKAGMYVDLASGAIDADAQTLLATLRDHKVKKKQHKAKEYSLSWGPEILPETHASYLTDFCDHFCHLVCESLREASDKIHPIPDVVYNEVLHHALFCFDRGANFVGRDEVLAKIQEYLQSSSHQPLVLYGFGGTGKSAVMAKVAMMLGANTAAGSGLAAAHASRHDSVVVLRFLGTSVDSTSIRRLLRSVCEQIQRNYKTTLISIPHRLGDLISHFHHALAHATKEKPMVLLLDSLDQLSTADNAHHLGWLPQTLPAHCKLVVSTLDAEGEGGNCLIKLKAQTPQDHMVHLPELSPDGSRDILSAWLSHRSRALTTDQFDSVVRSSAQCPLPLYLHVAFQLSLNWKSYTPLESTLFPSSLAGIFEHLFDKLCAIHGKILVHHAGGYLTLSRRGLSRSELEDVLSLDDEVLNDVYQWWVPPIRRIPSLLVTRLLSDLESYIVTHEVDGGIPVLNWYHREFKVAAMECFLTDRTTQMSLSRHLAEYFSNQYAKRPKPFVDKKGVAGRAQRKIAPQDLHLGNGKFNHRRVSELPSALIGAKDWVEVEKLLSDVTFLKASVTVGAIHETLGDVRRAIHAMEQDDVPPTILPQVAAFLSRSMYSLKHRPTLLYQCLVGLQASSILRQRAEATLNPPSGGYFQTVSTESPPSALITSFLVGSQNDQSCVAVAFSPDSSKVAAVTNGGGAIHLSVFDYVTNSIMWTHAEEECLANTLAWTVDGTSVILGTRNGELQFYSVAIGVKQHVWTAEETKDITSIACINEHTLVTADRTKEQLFLWSFESASIVQRLDIRGQGVDDHNDRKKITQLTMTSSREYLGVVSYNGECSIWECSTWTERATFQDSEGLKYASLSCDGTMLAVNYASYNDGEGAKVFCEEFDHPKTLSMEQLDMTGNALATCGLSFHPNHRSILYLFNSSTQIYAFDVFSERRLAVYAAPGHSFGGHLVMSNDGLLIATLGQENNVLLWNPAAQPTPLRPAGEAGGITFYPAGDVVAVSYSCANTAQLVAVDNPARLLLEVPNTENTSTACARTAFSSKGTRFASTTNSRSICLAELGKTLSEVADLRNVDFFEHEAIDVAVHPSGEYIAVLGLDKEDDDKEDGDKGHLRYIRWRDDHQMWEASDMIASACRMGGVTMQFAASGSLLACIHSNDKLSVLRTKDGSEAFSFPMSNGAHCFHLTPDFEMCAVNSGDSKIRVWTKGAHMPKLTFEPHVADDSNMTGVAVSPECNVVFSCTEGGILCASSLTDGALLAVYYNPERRQINAFDILLNSLPHPRLAIGDAAGRVTVLDWIATRATSSRHVSSKHIMASFKD
ncbi:unnamed protein product [Aphanomyces euteiches]